MRACFATLALFIFIAAGTLSAPCASLNVPYQNQGDFTASTKDSANSPDKNSLANNYINAVVSGAVCPVVKHKSQPELTSFLHDSDTAPRQCTLRKHGNAIALNGEADCM